MYEKFRNERKRSSDPQALEQRAKRQKSCKPSTEGKHKNGDLDWQPLFPEGEDEQSMQLHRTVLKSEWKKRCPDWDKLNSRMEITFADRRKMINDKEKLLAIKEKYPVLFCHDQVNQL